MMMMMMMTATMTWAYLDCGENKEVGDYSGPTQKPYVPLGNHTNRVRQKKRPLILWAQGTLLGISQWPQQLIRRGRLRGPAPRQERYGGTETECLSLGETSFGRL